MSEDIDQKLLLRYEIIQKVRTTTSGMIWKAIDRKTQELVAIKKLAMNAIPMKIMANLRETLVLQEMGRHPNIIQVLKVIYRGQDIYIIYEYVEMDLISLIKAKVLHEPHIQAILYNITVTLYYIHSGGMIHLNLDPCNILVDSQCQIKLIGFGHSQIGAIKETRANNLNYCAPELLIQSEITSAADIWSLGCIFAEMLSRRTLFTATTALMQIEQIIELIGKPSTNQQEISSYILQAIQSERRQSIQDITTDQTAIDLLLKMLTFNSSDRITLLDMVKHPYLVQVHNPKNLRKPLIKFQQVEEVSIKGFQENLRDKSKRYDPTTFQQQTSFKVRSSMKDISPSSNIKTKKTVKQISPIQSPGYKQINQEEDHTTKIRRKA